MPPRCRVPVATGTVPVSDARTHHRPAGPPAADSRPADGGVGRPGSAAAEVVSDALRRGSDPFTARRRRISAFTLGAMASLGTVAAYQVGLLKHLPEPPGRFFDADRVDASAEAYQFLKTPDAALGLASYAATLVLAGRRAGEHPSSHPMLSLVLGAKVAADAAGALLLTVEQGTKHRRFCSWCLAAAALSVATLPQVVPEVRAAWHGMRRG